MANFDPRQQIHEASRCRTQSEECHRLMLLAESGAEATILTSLYRSWKMIANQTDRYVAIMKREAAQKRRAVQSPASDHSKDKLGHDVVPDA